MLSQITQVQNQTLRQKSTPLKQYKNDNNSPSFKGAGAVATQAFNFLNTSPAVGACFVDFFSMVLPRTLVDFNRSPDAGLETGFRESSGTINHALAGFVGLGAGYMVSRAFNKDNGVKAHLMFMDGKTVDTFKDFVVSSVDNNGYNSKSYWTNFFKNIEGFNTTNGEQVWKPLSEATVQKATNIMTEFGTEKYTISKDTWAKISELITGETGAGSTFRLLKTNEQGAKVPTSVEGPLKNLVTNANSMLTAVVQKAKHDNTHIVEDLEKFLKGVKNKKLATVGAGLAVPVAIGMSAQPINRYLTKKRTGTDGFVGVAGREPDKSTGFKVMKLVVGLAMGTAMIATILKKPQELYTNIKKAAPEILSKLQYKGIVPTLDQFKFIYGMTIMSRVMASRDKNELRECGIKDSLGFANWLILGGFVSKLASKAFNKGLINYDEVQHGKGVWSFIQKSVEKTHEEILYPVLKKFNISTTTAEGKALPFRKLLGLLKSEALKEGASPEAKQLVKETLSRLKFKNFAQALGYLYSGIVLGYGIPKLNIAITKYYDSKNNADKPEQNSSIQDDKMKVASEFMKKHVDTKTFGAFYNAM